MFKVVLRRGFGWISEINEIFDDFNLIFQILPPRTVFWTPRYFLTVFFLPSRASISLRHFFSPFWLLKQQIIGFHMHPKNPLVSNF